MDEQTAVRGTSLHLNRMRGRPVIDARGDNLGTVEDVVVEPGTWRISGFLVRLRREVAERLDLEHGLLEGARVEVGSDRVKTVGENVLLNVDVDAMAARLRGGRGGEGGGTWTPPPEPERRTSRASTSTFEPAGDLAKDETSRRQPYGGPPGF